MTQANQAYSFNDFPIFTGTLDELPQGSSPILVNTINQYSFCMANEDLGFKESLQMSDVLLPDGIGVVVAEFLLTGKKIKKIAGADVHHHLLDEMKDGGKCFYLGASEETLSQIKEKMATEYPNIQVGTYSPPYKPEFTEEENNNMIMAVNEFEPDVVFVGMTAPKQEKWAFTHKNQLKTKIVCTIGAVFDFYAGTVKRPGKIWRQLGLEWLGRLVAEPKRLWRRYLYYGPIFIWMIVKESFRLVYSTNRPESMLNRSM